MTPSIKVWDPYNVLTPPPPLPPLPAHFHRVFCGASGPDDDRVSPSHGECHMNLRPDLIPGRSPDVALMPNGKRQARALAVFLKSQGMRVSAVYRVLATAQYVCQLGS
ncbi:6-phosphofructo-2-kinase/fructose-2,6-bisphosphatase 1 [Striga asiatica]|uniref:6-phosphofructo-2-kinase/fructose-2,6-bisphosphatase 1 n=1 Tax=Striga asiatica TaxID=4170 RepID=A0A5A7PKC5_STRAF|nr:6-phosphofructo-2-kinase/fructose-2,6-bisphosphatase 1 [Striga asiatica]